MLRGFLFVFLLLYLFLVSCKDQDASLSDKNAGNLKESKKDIGVDDGSWVYAIDDFVVTKEYFEREYRLFLNILSLGSGVSEDVVELRSEAAALKEDILERLINNRLTYKKALRGKFFSSVDGKNLVRSFLKIALNQYHIYKHIAPSITIPTKDELGSFYLKYKPALKSRGIIDTKSSSKELLKFYKEIKLKKAMSKEIAVLRLENSIKENRKVLDDFLRGRISKENINKFKKRYWLFDINGKITSLKEVQGIIDFHLQSLASSDRVSDKVSTEETADFIMSTIKTMELSYLYSLNKGYHKLRDAKQFIKLVQMRSISLYYLMNEVISKVTMPSYKEVRAIIKDKNKRGEFLKILSLPRSKYSKKDKEKLIRAELYKQRVLGAQNSFLSELKKEYPTKISKKYFETKADRIQNEILNR